MGNFDFFDRVNVLDQNYQNVEELNDQEHESVFIRDLGVVVVDGSNEGGDNLENDSQVLAPFDLSGKNACLFLTLLYSLRNLVHLPSVPKSEEDLEQIKRESNS